MGKTTLLAISGGLDSMVMLHYMIGTKGAGNLAVAHCNFQLRGEESDGDERFVESMSEQYGIEFFSIRFETKIYGQEHGIGIQQAARELRYDWFLKLKMENNYDSIATAHHLDDSIETYFINLLRGSGPKGLSGILEDDVRGLIRPLIDWSRKEIREYADRHELKWREDSSNDSDKYLRNQLRHQIVPKMKELRPGFARVMQRNMRIQFELKELLKSLTQKYKEDCFIEEGEVIRIIVDSREHQRLLLRTGLRDYGFSETQLENILSASQTGKQVMSQTHILTTHASGFLLNEIKDIPGGPWLVEETLRSDHIPYPLEFYRMQEHPLEFDPSPNLAYLDWSKLVFPLTLRLWKDGDRFTPFGMTGSKKVSDYLTDAKIPLEQKRRTMVLMSNNEVIWLVGHRISERHRVEKISQKVLVAFLKD